MTGTIAYADIVSRLLEAIPEFQLDIEDVTDNLVYLVFGDLMRFAKQALEVKPGSVLVQRIFAFLLDCVQ